MEECIVITTACDKKEIAEKIKNSLLEKRLVACCQISQMESSYWWKAQIETTPEFYLRLKTKKSLFEKVRDEIIKIHDYETCEVACFDMTDASEDFQKWVCDETINV